MCLFRSSRCRVKKLPVDDACRALTVTRKVASGARLIDSLKPVTRSARDTSLPSRGRYPWLARALSMGHGLRRSVGVGGCQVWSTAVVFFLPVRVCTTAMAPSSTLPKRGSTWRARDVIVGDGLVQRVKGFVRSTTRCRMRVSGAL